jgi:hypothetical protein
MSNDLPTADELGEKLKRGEITKEEAIEVMSERARREAFAGLYGPPPAPGAADSTPAGVRRSPWRTVAVVALVALLVLLLYVVLQLLG